MIRETYNFSLNNVLILLKLDNRKFTVEILLIFKISTARRGYGAGFRPNGRKNLDPDPIKISESKFET